MLSTASRGFSGASRAFARGLASRAESGRRARAATGAARKPAASKGAKRSAASPSAALKPSGAALAPASAQASVFVSEHFRLAPGDVEQYLDRHRVSYRRVDGEVVIEVCPFCHDTKKKQDNLFKLYVSTASGVYFCHRCAAKGSWFALRRCIGGDSNCAPYSSETLLTNSASKRPRGRPVSEARPAELTIHADPEPLPKPSKGMWNTAKENLKLKFPSVLERLRKTRGIDLSVLEKYGVGAERVPFYTGGVRGNFLSYIFPMFNVKGELVRFKVRAIDDKAHMKLDPKGGEWGLFGLNTVPDDAQEIVLTEGEFDAMAVNQATGLPAVSLPNGARSLPVSLLPALERFSRIFLWMDDDIPGQEGAQQFSRKLGVQRCYLVRGGTSAASCKDANDALLQGLDISAIIKQACPVPHEGVATFADLREEIFTEFTNPLQVQGIQSEFLPRLNSLLKGHRRGELSIVSGHTGVGKTTLLSQISLDYCMQGVPTLWGSFEISNVRIAKLLLSQYYARLSGKSPVGLAHEFDEWADKFSALPLYFMRYFGSNPIERVLDAMEYSNYMHDCAHVLVDNLQFMTSGQGRGHDRFEVMDNAVAKLRHFATSHNVHVSLVVHPRKENDDQVIQTASVFGTAKATQEADNLVVLQRTPNGPVLDVRKNRFDGTLGTLNLRFNVSSRMFEERDAPKREARSTSAARPSLGRGLGNITSSNQVTYMGVKSRVAL